MEDSTLWLWTDGRVSLSVEVFRPSSKTTPDEIVIDYMRWDNSSYVCNREAHKAHGPPAGPGLYRPVTISQTRTDRFWRCWPDAAGPGWRMSGVQRPPEPGEPPS